MVEHNVESAKLQPRLSSGNLLQVRECMDDIKLIKRHEVEFTPYFERNDTTIDKTEKSELDMG